MHEDDDGYSPRRYAVTLRLTITGQSPDELEALTDALTEYLHEAGSWTDPDTGVSVAVESVGASLADGRIDVSAVTVDNDPLCAGMLLMQEIDHYAATAKPPWDRSLTRVTCITEPLKAETG